MIKIRSNDGYVISIAFEPSDTLEEIAAVLHITVEELIKAMEEAWRKDRDLNE